MNHSSSQILATATDVFLTFDQAYKHYGASVEADFIAAKQRLDALVAARAANVRQRASAQQSLQALQLQRRDVAAAAAPAVTQFNHTATACRIYLDKAAMRAAKRQGLVDAILGVTTSYAEASGIATPGSPIAKLELADQSAHSGCANGSGCQRKAVRPSDCSCLSYYLYGASHNVTLRCCPAAYRLYDLQAVSSSQRDALRLIPLLAQGKY